MFREKPIEVAIAFRVLRTAVDDLIDTSRIADHRSEFDVRGEGRHVRKLSGNPEQDARTERQALELPFDLGHEFKAFA